MQSSMERKSHSPGTSTDAAGQSTRSDSQNRAKVNRGNVDPSSTSGHENAAQASNILPSSAKSSPKASRETSPIRTHSKQSGLTKASRSRKSSESNSRSRSSSVSGTFTNAPSLPSAAAVQRALSASNTPTLQPTVLVEPPREPRAQRLVGEASGESSPHWPKSPRLKSPPPSSSSEAKAPNRKSDRAQPPPSIVVQRSSATPTPQSTASLTDDDATADAESQDQVMPLGMRTPARGVSGGGPPLETVQENSLPTTPAKEPQDTREEPKQPDRDERTGDEAKSSQDALVNSAKTSGTSDIDSDSDNDKDEGKVTTRNTGKDVKSSRAHIGGPAKSYSALNVKGKSGGGEGLVQNMTVETETVSSIPQVAVGMGTGDRIGPGRAEAGGSLRMKPSVETLKPKKDKKKVARKAPSLTSGTGGSPKRPRWASLKCSSTQALPHELSLTSGKSRLHNVEADADCTLSHSSVNLFSFKFKPSYVRMRLTSNELHPVSSKADVFEAKVASAVDEANSSDSEETFVYESNPPEAHPARSGRYHSRTPSATSTQSQLDQRAPLRPGVVDGSHTVAGKRSMKFANNAYSNISDGDFGTAVESPGPGRGSGRGLATSSGHHHHIGHWGRSGRGQHTPLPDHEGVSPKSSKVVRSRMGNTSRHSSRPNSPVNAHSVKHTGPNGKKANHVPTYDIDLEGADDERTPLVGIIRTARNRHTRHGSDGSRRGDHSALRKRGWITRFASCLVLTVMVVLLISGAMGFLFATTTPLFGVRVQEIQNVLASEQEIMLDLVVEAINPNVVSVTVEHMKVDIFAKSSYVKTTSAVEAGDATAANVRERGRVLTRPSRSRSSRSMAGTTGSLALRGIDEGNDPIHDPSEDSQMMLLGRIYDFDSALTFEGSPLKHRLTTSVGEVRLTHPGNKTERGGTERWERVIQHPFELVVGGSLRYQLPLSSNIRTSTIHASVIVHPEAGLNAADRMGLTGKETESEVEP
ncbi:MAG: hypothetical protein M1833_005767 [Piccolia ochrophora]|nr:MAG: hypothetical protein M1833_005767 [Piccolia ochrophora]